MGQRIGLKALLDLAGWSPNVGKYLGDVGKLNAANTGASRALGGMSVGALAAGTALGHLAVMGAQAAIRGLGQLASTALESVTSFERLVFSTSAMVAQELQAADSTLSLSDALDQAGPRAAALVKWVERLAILSPFSVEDVKQTFNLAMGYGFTSEQAQRLTQATLNWGAATGKTGPILDRVSLALGQIQAAGRLTGQEMRQLTEAGIGVNTIMAQALGKTTAEIKTMVADGLIPADVALNAIIGRFETFGDAAARQAKSFSGLISSLGDIGPMLARNLFGPLDEATGKVGGLLGALQPRLASLVDILSSEAFNEGLANIGNTLGGYADNAMIWGENIVNSFAQGMFNAIGSILDALTQIGSLLAFWLSPGSPPRLLPNLDEWGAGAMTEYMRGWEQADFSVFDALSGTIESFLRSLSKDVIGEVDLIPTIIGSRESIAAAIAELDNTGQIAESTLQKVMASMGGAGRQVEGFVRSMFALEQANAAVAAAQDALNAVTAEYDALLKPLDDQIAGLDTAQENLRDTMRISQLELIANDPNATAGERELARMEIEKLRARQSQRLLVQEKKGAVDAAQAQLDAERVKQAAAQEAFDQQKALIAVQTENNKLLAEQPKLLEKLAKEEKAKAAGGAGAKGKPTPVGAPGGFAGGVPPLPTPEMPAFLTDFLSRIDALKAKFAQMRAAWDEAWDGIKAKLAPAAAAFENVRAAFGNLVSAIQEKSGLAQTYVADMVRFIIEELGINLPAVFDNLADSLNSMADIWRKHGNTIMAIVNFFWRVLVATFSTSLTLISGLLAFMLNGLSATFDVWSLVFQGKWKEAWERAKEGLAKQWEIIKRTLSTALDAFLAIFDTNLEELKESWQGKFDNMQTIVETVWPKIRSAVSEAVTAIRNKITEKVEEARKFIDDKMKAAQSIFEGVMLGISTAITPALTAVDNFLDSIKGLWNWISSHVFSFKIDLPDLPDWAIPGSPTPFELGLRGIARAMTDLKRITAPALTAPLTMPMMTRGAGGSSTSNSSTYAPTYNYSPTYGGAPVSPARDFSIMEALSAV